MRRLQQTLSGSHMDNMKSLIEPYNLAVENSENMSQGIFLGPG